MDAGILPGKEKECFVVDDWPAKGGAELVPLQSVIPQGEEIFGIERVVAEVFVCCTMKAVGPGLHYHVDHAARLLPILSIDIAGLHAEFLDAIGVGGRHGASRP